MTTDDQIVRWANGCAWLGATLLLAAVLMAFTLPLIERAAGWQGEQRYELRVEGPATAMLPSGSSPGSGGDIGAAGLDPVLPPRAAVPGGLTHPGHHGAAAG